MGAVGAYHLFVVADSGGQVNEGSAGEANNVLESAAFTI